MNYKLGCLYLARGQTIQLIVTGIQNPTFPIVSKFGEIGWFKQFASVSHLWLRLVGEVSIIKSVLKCLSLSETIRK